MRRLDGRVAIVTGGGRGIGRAAVLEFAREGARIVVADRMGATGEETAGLVRAAGGEAIFVQSDVSLSSDARRLVESTVDVFGGLDILFNNAGIAKDALLADMSEEDWDQVIDTNLKGHFLCSKYAIPYLKLRGGGVIINMSSVMAFTALPMGGAYCASKAGILGLTRVLAVELARDNIRVNALAPGNIDTAMLSLGTTDVPGVGVRREVAEAQPVGYIGTPEQIARVAVWLASNEVDYMAGTTLVVDGGILARLPGPS